jgi:single-strand DNA-binding protein
MNSITLLACVKTPPALQAIGGERQFAVFAVEIAAYKDGDPPIALQVTAWGDLADEAMQRIQVNTYLTITGRLRIEKNKQPQLQISKFYQISIPVELPGINSASLVGRAGRDPEVRYFESGSMVANLTLAVNRASRDDEPDWFPLEIWGKQAQVAADYVRKGSLLGITGSFKLDCWTDRTTGEQRSKPLIRVNRLDLLSGKRDGEGGGNFNSGASSKEEAPIWNTPANNYRQSESYDDIPF